VGRLDRSATYVAGFLSVLAASQLVALGEQARRGYRPFVHAPVRVPLSWDMFATAIARCDVQWDPPLLVDGRRLGRLREAGQPLEWDPVYDHVEDYAAAAQGGCAYAIPWATIRLTCFTHEGVRVDHAFRCR
jgi:hypothetical protein